MSDSDRVSLVFIEETDFGILEPGNPVMEELRFTGEGLKQSQTITPSTQIRDDRQIHDIVRTDVSVAGDLNFEMSYASFDAFFEAALLSGDYTAEVVEGPDTDVTFAVVANQLVLTSSSLATWAVLLVHQWVKISGWTNVDAPANGIYKVKISTNLVLTVEGDLTGIPAVSQAAGDPITIKMGAQIVNGVEFRSFSIEKEFSDLSAPSIFAQYSGMAIDTFALTFTPDAIITGTFGFLGKVETSASSTMGDGTPTVANTNEIMASVNSVQALIYSGLGPSAGATLNNPLDATAFNLTLTNNLRARQKIGELGAISFGQGTVGLTGGLSVYMETDDLIENFLNVDEVGLVIIIQDTAGNSYVIDIPSARFTDGERLAGGQNQDVMSEMEFTAFRNASEDITVRIQRFAA